MGRGGAENSSSALLGVVWQAGVTPLKGVSIYLRKRLLFSVHFGTRSNRRSRLGLYWGAVAIFGNLPPQTLFNLLCTVFYTTYLCAVTFSYIYGKPLTMQSL